LIVVASAITVASFVGATAYTQNRLARVDALSSTLETNAIPSIQLLSRVAVRLTRLGQILDDIEANAPRSAPARATASAEVGGIERDVATYLRLPPLPGERAFETALRTAVTGAVDAVERVLTSQSAAAHAPSVADLANVDAAIDAAVHR
jgi:hypothetical protein